MDLSTLILLAAVFGLTFAVLAWLLFGRGAGKVGPDAGLRRGIERLGNELTLAEAARTRAEAENRAKSEFLAVMSHELRTPLTSILGFAEIIESQMFGPQGSARYAGYARDIRAGGEHLLAVVNEILDLSRIASGKLTLNEETFDLLGVMRETVALVEDRAAAQGLTLKVALPQNLPVLNADARMVKQMLINLLSNAIDFTPDGGWIVVTADGDGKGGLSLVVADTGAGIAAEELPRVLEPFHSVEGTSVRASGGVGLGLPLVKSLIELHGGEFQINSTVGKGTTVTLTFPPGRVDADRETAATRMA